VYFIDLFDKVNLNGTVPTLLGGVKKMMSVMSIEKIVEQALQDGYLTPAMEAEVGRICDNASELSIEEYMALDRLMGSLLTGDVVAVPRKQFINVMEELVLTEAIARVAEIEATSDSSLDVGDIAAYALNRLPPLYATTEEGASYQRQRAKTELQELIAQQVSEAISRYLDRPNFFPERQALGKNTGNEVLRQVSTLLQAYAPNFEQKS
jgi:GGDEF domain-containing protein